MLSLLKADLFRIFRGKLARIGLIISVVLPVVIVLIYYAADASLASTAPKGSVYFASAGFTLTAAKSSTGAAVTIEKGDMIVGNGSK